MTVRERGEQVTVVPPRAAEEAVRDAQAVAPPAAALLLRLQRTAGNAAVGRLLRARRVRSTLARAGWSGADVRAGGWTAQDRLVGRTLRLAVDGVTLGNTSADPQQPHTDEVANGRAIVVVPPNVSWVGVDVLLHFHGHNVGYRERTDTSTTGQPPGTVRDVDADEIEQQLESSGRRIIAILPQGTAGSGFNIPDPNAYVDQVLGLIPNHLPLSVTPTRGRVVISGHSGGGPAATIAATALSASATPTEEGWLQQAPLFLFDAINGSGELGTVRQLVIRWLNADLLILGAAGSRGPGLLTQRGIRLLSTWSGGVYAAVNEGGTWTTTDKNNNSVSHTVSAADSLKGTINKWFADHRGALGSLEAPLREQYRVTHVSGSHDYTVGTGSRATASDRNANILPAPAQSPARGAGSPDVPNYTAGTGHLEQALGRLYPEATATGATGATGAGSGASGATDAGTPALARMATDPPAAAPRALARAARSARSARSAWPARPGWPRTVARQVPPPGATATTAAPPTTAPAPAPDSGPADPLAEVRTVIAALREADMAVTTAAGGPRAARRAAKAHQTAARAAVQQAVLRLATTLRTMLPPRELLDGYLARTDVTTEHKVAAIGRLAVEVARMEFLLGRMYHRGAGSWETTGTNQGPFPEVYRSTVGGGTTDPWCTKFAGYAYTRLGFHAASGSTVTSMFHSGYRLQYWSDTGKTLGGSHGVQTTDAANTVGSGTGGSQLVNSGEWRALTHDLTQAARRAHVAHQDEEAARLAVLQTFLSSHPAPQAGDIVVKTRGSATTNDFSGGQSHTMMVERFDGRHIDTIEGNRSDQVGSRRLDLAAPGDTGQLIFLTRLGTQFFGNPAVQAPDFSGLFGFFARMAYSSELLLYVMHQVNARLVEIDFAQGWIASGDADAGVYEWQGGGGTGGSEN